MSIMVGMIIVGVAALTIIGVMYLVMQEKHEHEEYYIPGQPAENPDSKDAHA